MDKHVYCEMLISVFYFDFFLFWLTIQGVNLSNNCFQNIFNDFMDGI